MKEGINGLPVCVATNKQGASVESYLYGAHVTSWKTAKGEELLFISDQAVFAPPKAIRGGIPVCLPQFAKLGPLQQHGFARNVPWQLVQEGGEGEGGACAEHGIEAGFCLRLEVGEALQRQYGFPGKFVATLRTGLTRAGDLVQVLAVENDALSGPLELTCALHTYLRVADVSRAKVTGLGGCQYSDSTDGGALKQQSEDAVEFEGEVDRVYMRVPGPVVLEDAAAGRRLAVCMDGGFCDAVVWNQWATKSATMADFGDREYKEMVCIEAALAASGPTTVAPGEAWVGRQTVRHVV